MGRLVGRLVAGLSRRGAGPWYGGEGACGHAGRSSARRLQQQVAGMGPVAARSASGGVGRLASRGEGINELEDCVLVKETRGNRTRASTGHDAARSSREHREF